tara:strand:- start:3470 stop:4159 length:690 start_codon:yes stop_codon:yes gene_type:complete
MAGSRIEDIRFGAVETSTRLVDTIVEKLRDAIVGGDLLPGTALSVPALARALDVSRSPVREAVLQLVGDGLAVEQPRKGVVVATIDHEDLVRIHEIREYMEAAAARYCAERIERTGIDALQKVLIRQKQAVVEHDSQAYYETNADLHRLIAGNSNNPPLALMLSRFEGQMAIALQRISSSPAHMREAFQEHEEIVAQIRTGNGDKAELAMRHHIAGTLARVKQMHEDRD